MHRPLRHPDFANCNQQDAVEKIIPRDKRSFLIRPHKFDPCRLVLTLMVCAWPGSVHANILGLGLGVGSCWLWLRAGGC